METSPRNLPKAKPFSLSMPLFVWTRASLKFVPGGCYLASCTTVPDMIQHFVYYSQVLRRPNDMCRGYLSCSFFIFSFYFDNHFYSPAQLGRKNTLSYPLDKPWPYHTVGVLCFPRYVPSLLSRITFSIPTFQVFVLVHFHRTSPTQLTHSCFPLVNFYARKSPYEQQACVHSVRLEPVTLTFVETRLN